MASGVAWNAVCHNYRRESGGNTITRYDVCKIACKVCTAAVLVANIQSAFKRCGIYPFNPSVISDTVIAPSLSFQSSEPVELQQCPPSSSTVPIPQTEHTKDDQVARSFLEKRGGELLKNVQVAKVRRTLSKVVTKTNLTWDHQRQSLSVEKKSQSYYV